jgi:hypothetical protein
VLVGPVRRSNVATTAFGMSACGAQAKFGEVCFSAAFEACRPRRHRGLRRREIVGFRNRQEKGAPLGALLLVDLNEDQATSWRFPSAFSARRIAISANMVGAPCSFVNTLFRMERQFFCVAPASFSRNQPPPGSLGLMLRYF